MLFLTAISSVLVAATVPVAATPIPILSVPLGANAAQFQSSQNTMQRLDTKTGGNFSYNYVEGGISIGEGVGAEIGVSYELGGPLIGISRILFLTDDNGGVDTDLLSITAGVGYVHNLQRGLDFLGRAELEWGSIDVSNGVDTSDDEFGVRVRGGVRFAATEDLEIFGSAGIRTLFDSDFIAEFGAVYRLDSNWLALGRVDVDDNTQFLLGMRYNF